MTAKTGIDDLAIFGGRPAFDRRLHVGRPNIPDRKRLLERINDILNRAHFTNSGPMVAEFEARVADLAGVRHCVAMCNGTAALEIAIRALDMQGEVIVPSFTFVATAHALQWQEITPVFCDIDPRTHNINPELVEDRITPRTTGIIGVHLWGRPCDVESLAQIAERRKLKLLFDAAHAFACTHAGKPIGSFGDAEVFSFHATKFVNTLEGGAVVTDNDELAAKMRLMKNFGFTDYDQVDYIGTNGKMTEFSAAMGLTTLESLDEFIEVNRRNFRAYARELEGIPGVQMAAHEKKQKRNYQYVILEVQQEQAGINRDQLVAILHAENVIARRYFHPGCHRMEPYRSRFPDAGTLLPETEKVANRVICLPTATQVSEKDIIDICAILRLAVGNAKEVRGRLQQDPGAKGRP